MRNSQHEKVKNDLKEIINKGNESSETNKIEKDMFDLNVIKNEENDENNKGKWII